MADIVIDLRSGGHGGVKKAEEEIIKEAFSRQIGPHAIFQRDGSIKIGWSDFFSPPPPEGAVPIDVHVSDAIYFIIKFKDGRFDIIEMKKS